MDGTTETCGTESTAAPQTVPPLSKNAQKRLLRQKKFAETRAEWKAKIKAKKKARKAQRLLEAPPEPENANQPKAKIVQEPACGEIIIDLAFEELMQQKNMASLASQISRCYASNRRTSKPYNLKVLGLGGATEAQLRKAFPEYDRWQVDFRAESLDEYKGKAERAIVYLSADAEETLEEIDPDCAYVIGGLIDRNRHKNAASDRAKALGLKTVRLPLSEHVRLNSSAVLTIVHVYELLCQQRELGNWGDAVAAVIPERKRLDPEHKQLD